VASFVVKTALFITARGRLAITDRAAMRGQAAQHCGGSPGRAGRLPV